MHHAKNITGTALPFIFVCLIVTAVSLYGCGHTYHNDISLRRTYNSITNRPDDTLIARHTESTGSLDLTIIKGEAALTGLKERPSSEMAGELAICGNFPLDIIDLNSFWTYGGPDDIFMITGKAISIAEDDRGLGNSIVFYVNTWKKVSAAKTHP